jgi:beta-galactosidase GanA
MKIHDFVHICRYIEWSSHEPEPGSYNFDGNMDISRYFKLAQYYNLSVILRPGPFIDAERDMVTSFFNTNIYHFTM